MRLLIIMLLVFVYGNAHAWSDKDKTHKLLSEYVVTYYFDPDQYNVSINGETMKYWILQGSDLEDQGSKAEFIIGKARSLNHFHAPTRPLSSAGLNDIILPYLYGESALAWAQDATTQNNKAGGDWSWQRVRQLYYSYLTTSNIPLRETVQSEYLKGLGYQMHLIQDMSQPNHVRNDTHMYDGSGNKKTYGFETWAATNKSFINNILSTIPIPNVSVDLTKPFADTSVAPIPVARLFDTREHLSGGVVLPSSSMNQGLSEFTNTNFFSEDTTFADGFSTANDKYFPYPAKSETNLQSYINSTLDVASVTDSDGSSASYFKISKQNTTGVALSCLAKAGPNSKKYYTELGEGAAFYKSFRVDDECFKEYSQHLFPRAVAYSKAMLDYFFRGTIELSLPAQGVYATAAPGGTFNEIRVKAKNNTASGEEMSNGTIHLVVKYNLSLADPFQSILVDLGPDTYIVVPEKNAATTIAKTTPTELVFDLSSSPLPLWAANVSIQVVFKGKLGNEENAVAVGYSDISEPTPVDVYNNTDYSCLNSTWYRYDDPAAMAIVDSNHDGIADRSDIYPHNINNISFLGGSANASTLNAVASNNLFAAGPLPPGQLLRMGYILTNYAFRFAINETRTGLNGDPFTHIAVNNTNYSGTGFENDWNTQDVMFEFRGQNVWWGTSVVFINTEYNGTCSWDALNQLLGL